MAIDCNLDVYAQSTDRRGGTDLLDLGVSYETLTCIYNFNIN